MSEKYWFKRKRYGCGSTPSTWQGWVTFFGFLFFIIFTPNLFLNIWKVSPWIYLVILLTSIVIFIKISIKKSPKWKWRWGRKSTDNPEEDF